MLMVLLEKQLNNVLKNTKLIKLSKECFLMETFFVYLTSAIGYFTLRFPEYLKKNTLRFTEKMKS